MRREELCVHTLSTLHGLCITFISPNTHINFLVHLLSGKREKASTHFVSVNVFEEILFEFCYLEAVDFYAFCGDISSGFKVKTLSVSNVLHYSVCWECVYIIALD